ncbi:MAG: glycosyltransferase family 2 protein [Alphaproteobacteria bacterium]
MPLDVSVIIPAYRAETTIGRALKSVAAQTAPPREVIVVDDGSPDGTAAAAESCRAEMRDIALKVVRQKNAGAGAARNRAVQNATSTFVAFLDADDEWLPEKLEQSFDVLNGKNLDLVSHNYDAVGPDGSVSRVDCAARFREGPDPFVTLYRKGYLSTSTLITRRDLVLDAGGFDTTLANAQDFDLWLAILQNGERSFEVFDGTLTRYHVTEGSITANTERRIRCCLDVALRFAPALKSGRYVNLWTRTLAVYLEACRAYHSHNQSLRALWAALRAVPALICITANSAFSTPPPRRRNL